MFRSNSRNSFLQKICPNLPRSSLDETLGEVFFRHLNKTKKDQQVFIVNEFNEFKRNVSKGFGEIGLENLVSDIFNREATILKTLSFEGFKSHE